MPDDITTPPTGGAPVTPTDAGSAGNTDIAAIAKTMLEQLAAVSAKVDGFKREWTDERRELRNKFNAGKAGEPTTPAPVTAAQSSEWNADAKLAFRDAVDESGLTVSVPQRKVLEKLFRAEPGISDPVSWVREQAAAFGWKPTTPPAVTPPAATTPPVVTPPPQMGAPTGTAAGQQALPDDPSLIPQSVIDQMTPEEALAHYKKWKSRQGTFRHPFTSAREAERTNGQELSNMAAALRQVLAGKK